MKTDNSIVFAMIGIVVSMILLPITTMYGPNQSLPVWIGIFIYITWMVIKGKPGYSVILIAIAMCQPNVTSEEVDFSLGLSYSRYYYYSLFIIPVFVLFLNLLKKNRIPIKAPFYLSLLFFILGLLYNLSLTNILYAIVASFVAFLVGYFDRLDFSRYFILFSIILAITTIYAALEFHFRICPYNDFYTTSQGYVAAILKRAQGLLGNPLILLSFATFYMALLCAYAVEYKKIVVLPLLACIYLCLIVVSRTAVISLVVFFLLYNYYSKSSLKLKIPLLFAVGIACYAAYNFLTDTVGDLLYRLQNSDLMHRQSGFSIVSNILQDNFFGLGFENYSSSLRRYATSGFNTDVDSLDNFFLTQIAHYGYLGIMVLLFYLYYFWAYFKSRRMIRNSKEILFLFVAFAITGFCFDFLAFNNVSLFVYVMVGSAFGRCYNTAQSVITAAEVKYNKHDNRTIVIS